MKVREFINKCTYAERFTFVDFAGKIETTSVSFAYYNLFGDMPDDAILEAEVHGWIAESHRCVTIIYESN